MYSDLAPTSDSATLAARYAAVRACSAAIVAHLSPEDLGPQSMPDASPGKWHLAHTTWFFEEMVLRPHQPGFAPVHPDYAYQFNSYYEAVGARHPRPKRGLQTRPLLADIMAYRHHVDAAIQTGLAEGWAPHDVITLGLAHEEQHQELMHTDLLHLFAQNRMGPALVPGWVEPAAPMPAQPWSTVGGDVVQLGHAAKSFAFDNEGPAHRAYVAQAEVANALVTNAQYAQFIAQGGYTNAAHWLSDGWFTVQKRGWTHPLYWRLRDGHTAADGASAWDAWGPGGWAPLNPDAPVVHVSLYEADAYARAAGARLATEGEWELWARAADPADPVHAESAYQVGWQWTQSAYSAYPGFRALPGALGEYNGKFMSGQNVLRGGSAFTSTGHTRTTYRNFFPPSARWQRTAIRLARDLPHDLSSTKA